MAKLPPLQIRPDLHPAWRTKNELDSEDIEALQKGVPNLLRHVSKIRNVYKLPCVVAVNRFPTDTDNEIEYIIAKCRELGVNTVLSTVWADGSRGVNILPAAKKEIEQLTKLGYGAMPVCIAKTQYSFSDDPTKLGAPEDFDVTVRNAKVSAGAGFIVARTGDILTMPGLPKRPAAERIDVDENGVISGQF